MFVSRELRELAKDMTKNVQLALKYNDREREILSLFYDEKLQARQEQIPKFFIYAQLLDKRDEFQWPDFLRDINGAIKNLIDVGYIEPVESPLGRDFLKTELGYSSQLYKLSAVGLERLQSRHPAVRLQIAGWLKVIPPWAKIAGSIFGGIGAVWGATKLGIELF